MLPAQNVMLSYGRCCASPAFFDDFYQRFLASSPRVREKFVHTDMAAQQRLLRHGIMNLLLVARGMPATRLRQLGESHCRARLDIGPELYEGWIDCLLATSPSTIQTSTRPCARNGVRCWKPGSR